MEKMRDTKGITLISLVVTIIVLIILAAVSISLVLGENGLIQRTQKAAEEYQNAQKKEQEELEGIVGEMDEITNSQYNETKGINQPKITEGMIPIKYNGTNWVICSKDDLEWYDYTNKNWANIMLSDGTYNGGTAVGTVVADNQLGSMFVWIPRYAYSIKEYKTAKTSPAEGNTQGITDITFLLGGTNRDNSGTQYMTDYTTDSVEVGAATPKIVHPAFTFGGTNLTRNMGSKI